MIRFIKAFPYEKFGGHLTSFYPKTTGCRVKVTYQIEKFTRNQHVTTLALQKAVVAMLLKGISSQVAPA